MAWVNEYKHESGVVFRAGDVVKLPPSMLGKPPPAETGVIENIVTLDNSPDFGLHFGVQHRF